MTKIIELIFKVDCITWFRIRKLNCRLAMANSVAPTAPTDADSVGVAMPARIEPRTAMINSMGGMTAIATRPASPCRSAAVISRAGQDSGRVIALNTTQPV